MSTDETDTPNWHDFRDYKVADAPPFHPGWRPADVERGVVYQAPWQDPFAGFPTHARRCALSLNAAGVPVKMLGLRGMLRDEQKTDKALARALQVVQLQMQPMVRASIKYTDAEIVQTIADEAALMRFAGESHHWMSPEELAIVHRHRVISTVFERDRLSDQVRACLRRVRQVWVANQQDAAMLRREGIEDVRVIPIPYMPDDPHLQLQGRKRWAGAPRFLHIGKWEPRKNQRKAMHAFLRAFKPGEAKFYVKTSFQGPRLDDYPRTPQLALRELLELPDVRDQGWRTDNIDQSVFLVTRRLDQKQMVSLHASADVYVSLSHGEGFDMPAYDAKLSGNALLFTPSGGPQDFASHTDYLVPFCGKIDCHAHYRWGGGAQYGDYDVDVAVEKFRSAAEDVRSGNYDVKDVRMHAFAEVFSSDAVGEAMKTALQPFFDDADKALAARAEAKKS